MKAQETSTKQPQVDPLITQGNGTTPQESELPRRANLSTTEFLNEHVFPNQPVILTDAPKEWKALKRWTPELFQSEFGDMKFTLNDEGVITHNTMRSFIDQVLASTPKTPLPISGISRFTSCFQVWRRTSGIPFPTSARTG